MPLDEKILGFSNRWYGAAMERATAVQLSEGLEIRGRRDYFASQDLADFVFVIAGRPEIVDELRAESTELVEYMRKEIARLLRTRGFIDALPGFLLPDAASQARIGTVLERSTALTQN